MRLSEGAAIAAALAMLLALSLPVAAQGVCDGVSPVTYTDLKTVTVATGLAGRPLFATAPPGDTDRIFIVEQDGLILIHRRGDPPATLTTFLDLSTVVDSGSNESGLLGLAFDPDYDSNGFFYVNYTESAGLFTLRTVVARYTVSGNPDVADPGSESRLLTIAQPQFQTNHNGGLLLIGPDDMLYVFTGDGGGANDQHGTCGNGQVTGTLLGKILRIDPSGGAGLSPDCGGAPQSYTVPSDNPLADGPGGDCDEIYAYGLRNPWRASFDPGDCDGGTGRCALYTADVGQNCWEEVNYVSGASTGGENYGWRQMEGKHFFRPGDPSNCTVACEECAEYPMCSDVGARTLPVHEYANGGGDCSVTGGYVYRGCRMPGLRGNYFFGDYCSGDIDSFEIVAGSPTNPTAWTSSLDPANVLAFDLTSFGLNGRGELLVAKRGNPASSDPGEVWKVLPLFTDLQVSGPGAGAAFLLEENPDVWSWEDLAFETEHPVTAYRIYRGQPNDDFSCIHTTTGTEWIGGDPTPPGTGQILAYLVTAESGGEETGPGAATDGTPRSLLPGCP